MLRSYSPSIIRLVQNLHASNHTSLTYDLPTHYNRFPIMFRRPSNTLLHLGQCTSLQPFHGPHKDAQRIVLYKCFQADPHEPTCPMRTDSGLDLRRPVSELRTGVAISRSSGHSLGPVSVRWCQTPALLMCCQLSRG